LDLVHQSPDTKVSELSPSSPLIKATTILAATKIAWRRLDAVRRKLAVKHSADKPQTPSASSQTGASLLRHRLAETSPPLGALQRHQLVFGIST